MTRRIPLREITRGYQDVENAGIVTHALELAEFVVKRLGISPSQIIGARNAQSG